MTAKTAAKGEAKQINKVPWITTAQADKLWIAAKKVQAALSELEGVDLLPDSTELKNGFYTLDHIISEIEADN